MMTKPSRLEGFSIKLGRAKSDVFSFISGAMIGAAVNVLTSLAWSTVLKRDLPCALISSFLIGLAGVISAILSWRIKDIQEIVNLKTHTPLLSFPSEEERWQFAICKDNPLHRKTCSLIYLLIFSCIFATLGIVIIILWISLPHSTSVLVIPKS